jgi:hypothetical protein
VSGLKNAKNHLSQEDLLLVFTTLVAYGAASGG